MKHLIAGFCPGTGTLKPFGEIFTHAVDLSYNPDPWEELDGLILWGGEDIAPVLYNQENSRSQLLQGGNYPSERDKFEWEMIRQAVKHGKPIIAVCRGAQLVTAFAGGSLIQHVNNHSSSSLDHVLETVEGEEFRANSIHHQMMNPYDLPKEDYQVLAWTKKPLSHVYIGEDGTEAKLKDGILFRTLREPEIVYYPKLKALCIQGHPEWEEKDSKFVEYCIRKAKELLFTQLTTCEC